MAWLNGVVEISVVIINFFYFDLFLKISKEISKRFIKTYSEKVNIFYFLFLCFRKLKPDCQSLIASDFRKKMIV